MREEPENLKNRVRVRRQQLINLLNTSREEAKGRKEFRKEIELAFGQYMDSFRKLSKLQIGKLEVMAYGIPTEAIPVWARNWLEKNRETNKFLEEHKRIIEDARKRKQGKKVVGIGDAKQMRKIKSMRRF